MLVLVAVSSVLALGLAELCARLWVERAADDASFRRYASLAQLRSRMEQEGQSLSPYVPHRYTGYIPAPGYRRGANRHNGLGYRGAEIPREKPPGEFRIACLGGSTTYGGKVSDWRDAYPARLEAELRERGHSRVRVINAGAEGWASQDSLANLELRVLDLEPDLVIVYHAVNDLHARMVWPYRLYRGDAGSAVQHSPGLDRDVPLLERSTVARMILILSGQATSQLALLGNFTVVPDTARYFAFRRQKRRGVYPAGYFLEASVMDMLDHNPPVYFRRNLANMVVVARADGAQAVLATFALFRGAPDQPALTSDEVARGIAEHNEVIREVGRELGAPVFELAAALPADAEHFATAVHLTAKGNWLKARLFADFLEAQQLLPERRDAAR